MPATLLPAPPERLDRSVSPCGRAAAVRRRAQRGKRKVQRPGGGPAATCPDALGRAACCAQGRGGGRSGPLRRLRRLESVRAPDGEARGRGGTRPRAGSVCQDANPRTIKLRILEAVLGPLQLCYGLAGALQPPAIGQIFKKNQVGELITTAKVCSFLETKVLNLRLTQPET